MDQIGKNGSSWENGSNLEKWIKLGNAGNGPKLEMDQIM